LWDLGLALGAHMVAGSSCSGPGVLLPIGDIGNTGIVWVHVLVVWDRDEVVKLAYRVGGLEVVSSST